MKALKTKALVTIIIDIFNVLVLSIALEVSFHGLLWRIWAGGCHSMVWLLCWILPTSPPLEFSIINLIIVKKLCITTVLPEHRPGCARHWKMWKRDLKHCKKPRKVGRKASGWIRWTTPGLGRGEAQRGSSEILQEAPYSCFVSNSVGGRTWLQQDLATHKAKPKRKRGLPQALGQLRWKNIQSKSCTGLGMGPIWWITHAPRAAALSRIVSCSCCTLHSFPSHDPV